MASRFPNECNYIEKNGSVCLSPCICEKCYKHSSKQNFKKCGGAQCEKFTVAKLGFCTECGIKYRSEIRKERKNNETLYAKELAARKMAEPKSDDDLVKQLKYWEDRINESSLELERLKSKKYEVIGKMH